MTDSEGFAELPPLRSGVDSGLCWDVFAQPRWAITDGTPTIIEHELLVRPRGNRGDAEAFYDAVSMLPPEGRVPIELHALQVALQAARIHVMRLGRVAVNVTPFLLGNRLGQAALWDGLSDRLSEQLTLEIVEYDPLDVPQLAPLLARLTAHGVALAMDDYGKGFACLPSLIHLPMIRQIKLSGVYHDHPRARAVLPMVLEAVRRLDVEATMERIETAELLQECRDLGIPYAQGHYLAEPFPLATSASSDATSFSATA